MKRRMMICVTLVLMATICWLFWPAEFRDEVLARLLALNTERAAAERGNEPLPPRPRAKGAQKGGRRHDAQPAQPASPVPSFGRAEAPRRAREADAEPADHSHLPAFLLRPVRDRVGS